MLDEFSFEVDQAHVCFAYTLPLGIKDSSHFVERGFKEADMDVVAVNSLKDLLC